MRSVLILCFILAVSPALHAAETAGEWLDRASDAALNLREREYAARQVLMLADPSASILIAALKGEGSDSALRRQVAARLLGELSLPQAEEPLLEAAFGKDYFLAEAAKAALARYYSRMSDNELYGLLTRVARARAAPGGEGGDDWLYLSLRRDENKSRFQALVMRGVAVKFAGPGQSLPEPLQWCVWEALLSPDVEFRLNAVSVIPRIADASATEKLAAFLYTENDPKLLVASLRAMAEMRPPDYGAAVERHVRHDDPMVQLEALNALAAMGYPGALFPSGPGMRAAATFVVHPSTPVRRRAVEILAGSKNPAALEYLESALFDRVPANRAAAARALGELGFTGAVGGLSPLMRDSHPEVRAEAAVALAKLGVLGIVSTMVDELKGGAMPFRIAAAGALGRMGDRRAVPALVEGAASDDPALALAAVEALGRLGDKAAGGALAAVMGSGGNPALADAARQALSQIYGDDPGTGPDSQKDWARRNGL